jgi:hypothetical protein
MDSANTPFSFSYFYTQFYKHIQKECLYKNISTQKNLVCFIFNKKKILSIGVNYILPIQTDSGSIHAEVEAFRTLKKNDSIKIKKINIFVTRFAIIEGKIQLKLSKPCLQCINYMNSVSNIKRYKIQNVYYTKENSELGNSSLHELLYDKNYFVSSHQQKKNCKVKVTKRNLIF